MRKKKESGKGIVVSEGHVKDAGGIWMMIDNDDDDDGGDDDDDEEDGDFLFIISSPSSQNTVQLHCTLLPKMGIVTW